MSFAEGKLALAEEKAKQKGVHKESVVEASDPNDRLRATEGCFLMTDMADVESIAEPTNNGKVFLIFC